MGEREEDAVTVMQLGGALLWGLFGTLPIMFGIGAGAENDGIGASPLLWLAFALQIFFGVACYMAGVNA